jgi:hypothetical protein
MVAMAKLELPDLPSDLGLASKVIELETQRTARLLEMGWIGKVFGSVQDKPGNIAGFAIIASFLVLVGILVVSAMDPAFKTDAVLPIFTGIITLALGYLFGKGGG